MVRFSVHVFVRAVLFVSLTTAASDQLQGQQPETTESRTFRGGVEVVELDVSVLVKKRLPVRGLTESNFSIFEAAFAAVDTRRHYMRPKGTQ